MFFDTPDNLWVLRLGIIVTVILHGIILPFSLPFFGNYHVHNIAKSKGINAIEEAHGTYTDIDSWAHETLAQIKDSIGDANSHKRHRDSCILNILYKIFK